MQLRNKFSALLIFVCLCLCASVSSAEVVIPDKPSNYVVDLAGIMDDSTEATLNKYLLELEQKTTAQMVVLTINSLEGESLEDFSIKTAHEKWKLGQKGKDNGVLLLVSLQDRKYRFEIGYGLEGTLPDSFVGSIGRTYLMPYFKKEDYSAGIFKATFAVINKIASDSGVEITEPAAPQGYSTDPYRTVEYRKPSIVTIIITILFFIIIIYMFIRHPKLLLLLLMSSMIGSGRRGGWGGGGFSSGGGGFGGVGGGFGGGGSSGSW
ncbi:MAG: TPM domain-containing protein [Nitrospirota bacterium]